MIATNVGWVEERNPTPQSPVIVGFHDLRPKIRVCPINFAGEKRTTKTRSPRRKRKEEETYPT